MEIKKPIVHVYTVCWNEEKLIPHFLKHYDKIVDKFFIYDNGSTDNSVNIASLNPKVTVCNYNTNNTFRDDANLIIKNNEWKRSRDIADIVIVSDQDEFLYSENLEQIIIDFYRSDCTIVKPIGCNLMLEKFDHDNCDDIFSIATMGCLSDNYSKQVIFKPNEISEMNFGYGCHHANPTGNVKYLEHNNIKLLHCRQLDIEYFISRIAEYQKRLSKFNKDRGLGFHYLKSLDEWRKDFEFEIKKIYKII